MVNVVNCYGFVLSRKFFFGVLRRRYCWAIFYLKHLAWIINYAPIVLFRVIKSALRPLRTITFLTGVHLVIRWMVELFLPTMTFSAKGLQLAALLIATDESASLPIFAQLARVVVEKMRFAPKVLPIVRIQTYRSVVIMI